MAVALVLLGGSTPGRALPVREIAPSPGSSILSTSLKYKFLLSLEHQERAPRVPETRIRDSALRGGKTDTIEGRLKEELDWVCGPGGRGLALDLVYLDDYRLATLKDGNETRAMAWMGGNIFAEFQDGAEKVFNVTLGLDQNLETGPPAGPRETLVTDQVESFVAALDDSGAVVRGAQLGAFGEFRLGADPGAIGFAGARRHQATGYSYMRNRWYSPELGRFLSRDRIGFSGGLNLYAYAGSNPINHRDPTGLAIYFDHVMDGLGSAGQIEYGIKSTSIGQAIWDAVSQASTDCGRDVHVAFDSQIALQNAFTGETSFAPTSEIAMQRLESGTGWALRFGYTPQPLSNSLEARVHVYLGSEQLLANNFGQSTAIAEGWAPGWASIKYAERVSSNDFVAARASVVVHELVHVLNHVFGIYSTGTSLDEVTPFYAQWQFLLQAGSMNQPYPGR